MILNDPTSRIQSIIDGAVKEHEAVVVGLISPNVAGSPKLLYAGASTLWNTQHKPLTLDGDTPFLIASITKTFTSAVQYLCQQNYDGTLGEVIKVPNYELPQALSSLPILDLANYSPGFPTDNKGAWWPKGTADSLQSLVTYLSQSSNLPQNNYGTCYSYSNFGWGLLALAASGVTSFSDDVLGEWAQQIGVLSTDIGLNNTEPYASSIDPNLPVGYNSDGKRLPVDFDYGQKGAMLFGAGDLVSTGNDMTTWLSFNMGIPDPNLTLLKLQQGQSWTMPNQCPPDSSKRVPTVGLAWFFHNLNIDGQQVTFLAKDGGLAGFSSWMGFQAWVEAGVASKVGAFVLTNTNRGQPLGMEIIQILLGATPEDLKLEPHYVTPDPV